MTPWDDSRGTLWNWAHQAVIWSLDHIAWFWLAVVVILILGAGTVTTRYFGAGWGIVAGIVVLGLVVLGLLVLVSKTDWSK